ncbi:hypothetical protein AZH53_00450 [Methanomicrobiaceae archaeon CYW5]|uniref:hypothetical protein n=1 Tax=Methanovulcanius yangii TaxID=1789227 RepID=UPI0029CA3214|nr:hypothetical protein [Methanovulcanius yangii]MBT8506899.1 hypothetical protein [Methanovulcanius yangii]
MTAPGWVGHPQTAAQAAVRAAAGSFPYTGARRAATAAGAVFVHTHWWSIRHQVDMGRRPGRDGRTEDLKIY